MQQSPSCYKRCAIRPQLTAVDSPLLAIFLGCPDSGSASLPTALEPLDQSLNRALSRTLARRDFRGGRDETLLVVGAERGVERVLLVGLGKGTTTRAMWRRAGAVASRAAAKLGVGAMHAYAGDASAEQLEGLVAGLALGAWTYTDLRTPAPESERRAPLDSGLRHRCRKRRSARFSNTPSGSSSAPSSDIRITLSISRRRTRSSTPTRFVR